MFSSKDESQSDKWPKFMLIGDTKVGKTSLIKQFCKNEFPEQYTPTLHPSCQIKSHTLDSGSKLKFMLWDFSGQEKFRCLLNSFFRGISCVIFVFDLTDRESFDGLKTRWISFIKQNCLLIGTKMCFVGNKYDLKEQRKVDKEEGEALAKSFDSMYFEVSANNSIDVNQMFEECFLFSQEEINTAILMKEPPRNLLRDSEETIDKLKSMKASEIKDASSCLLALYGILQDVNIKLIVGNPQEPGLAETSLRLLFNGDAFKQVYKVTVPVQQIRDGKTKNIFLGDDVRKKTEIFKEILTEELNIFFMDDSPIKVIIKETNKDATEFSFFLINNSDEEISVPANEVCAALIQLAFDIEVTVDPLYKYLQLSLDLFEPTHNKMFNDGSFAFKALIRNDHVYYPPIGWYGYGLKVAGKFDHGNDEWINGPKFWFTGYNAVRGPNQSSIGNVQKSWILSEANARGSTIITGQKKKVGAYLSPKAEIAQKYTREFEYGTKKYQMLFQCRVDPEAIKVCEKISEGGKSPSNGQVGSHDYWIVKNTSKIRPYRILIQEKSQSTCNIF